MRSSATAAGRLARVHGTEPGPPPQAEDWALLGRRRRYAWVVFLLLAAYAPALAFLTRDDSWLFPLAVAGMVGYVILVDDHLRRRAARSESSEPGADTTRDRRMDGPGSVRDDGP